MLTSSYVSSTIYVILHKFFYFIYDGEYIVAPVWYSYLE